MKIFDVIIIGGGINGAGLLRDLALNGVSALLLDKADFSSQTSQSSSKMLHGGIRYLENMDFGLIKEALEEKNLWLKLAPHLCFEREFYLPTYKNSKYPLWMLKIGLFTYDLLSGFKNQPHATLNREETLKVLPDLNEKGLVGAGKYYDGVVDDSKMTLECIYDALQEENIEALNYHEVIKVEDIESGHNVTYKNRMGDVFTAKCKQLVFTTGPFTDKLLNQLEIPWKPQLLPSKGIHLWIKKGRIAAKGSVVLTTPDNRVIFVIPQRDSILVGTTETKITEDIFNIKAHPEEIKYLLSILNEYFPKSKLTDEDIISTFAGVRPLVKEDGASENLGKTSRFHKIFRPNHKIYVLIGGKYTTFRRMTQELAQEITARVGKIYHPNHTLNSLRQKSLYPTFGEKPKLDLELIKKIIAEEKVVTFEDLMHRRLSVLENLETLSEFQGIKISDIKKLF